MANMIYSLCITTGVDDYKHRGESPSSVVTLHKTYNDALESLKKFLRADLISRKYRYEVEYELDYVEKLGLEYIFLTNENGYYEFNEKLEILVDDIHKIHENFCEGEYIPYRWTYNIKSHFIPQ